MVRADIRDRLDLLAKGEIFVAVRSIYYLRDSIDEVFAEVAKHCRRAVLCGNAGRARRYASGDMGSLGEYNLFASRLGMTTVLQRHGYHIECVVAEGDPIVVGVR
jgi:hypothetical protein